VSERTIGELAREAGVNVETVRYYERRGLLEQPPRRGSGYRRYGDDVLWQLAFIGRAKQLGFTLTEIRELLGAGRPGPAADVLAAARDKLAKVDTELEQLATRRARLARLVESCEAGTADCVTLDVPAP